MLTRDDGVNWISKMARVRILVLGDLMLDEYIWGHVRRISPEAPVPIFNIVRQECTLGGAGNVVKNLCSLGVTVSVVGAVGGDVTGNLILGKLDELLVRHHIVREGRRISPCKTRLMSLEHGQQVFRFDRESTDMADPDTEAAMLERIRMELESVHAIICSDYMKGTLTPRVLRETISVARQQNVPVVIAPKDSDPVKYLGATVLIPNLGELEQLSGTRIDGPESLTQMAEGIIAHLGVQALLVTRGREGMSLFECVSDSLKQVDIPTAALAVYDVTGAGDTVASVFTAAVGAGASYEVAARIANIAAGIVVGKLGTAAVTPAEILDYISKRSDDSIRAGRKVVRVS